MEYPTVPGLPDQTHSRGVVINISRRSLRAHFIHHPLAADRWIARLRPLLEPLSLPQGRLLEYKGRRTNPSLVLFLDVEVPSPSTST